MAVQYALSLNTPSRNRLLLPKLQGPRNPSTPTNRRILNHYREWCITRVTATPRLTAKRFWRNYPTAIWPVYVSTTSLRGYTAKTPPIAPLSISTKSRILIRPTKSCLTPGSRTLPLYDSRTHTPQPQVIPPHLRRLHPPNYYTFFSRSSK
jgi:hypothetical protein